MRPFFVLCALLLLAGCSSLGGEPQDTSNFPDPDRERREEAGNIFGEGGLFGGGEGRGGGGGGMGASGDITVGVGVNGYLWRATLDTLAFMPIAQADPFGGTILTDWYSPPGIGNERFKVNAFILSPNLRADGVRVTVFRQALSTGGEWLDAAVADETAAELERTVLTRARQLRIAALNAQ